jgi:hypothetical protein
MKVFMIMLIGLLINSNVCSQSKDLILKCYNEYKTAVVTGDPQNVIGLVDSATLNRYKVILNGVKNADSLQLLSMPLIDRTIILTIRHIEPAEQIKILKDYDLLPYSIKHKMMNNLELTNDSKIAIIITENLAEANIGTDSNTDLSKLQFKREEGIWKMSLVSQFSQSEKIIKELIDNSGLKEGEFLMQLLENMSNKKPDAKIWHKP